jgi:hypothetical protein
MLHPIIKAFWLLQFDWLDAEVAVIFGIFRRRNCYCGLCLRVYDLKLRLISTSKEMRRLSWIGHPL